VALTAFPAAKSVRVRPCPLTQVELYEAGGLGSGASGAAAGLLHPFTPRGKLLWGGLDGYHATLRLVQIADEARGAWRPHSVVLWYAQGTHNLSVRGS